MFNMYVWCVPLMSSSLQSPFVHCLHRCCSFFFVTVLKYFFLISINQIARCGLQLSYFSMHSKMLSHLPTKRKKNQVKEKNHTHARTHTTIAFASNTHHLYYWWIFNILQCLIQYCFLFLLLLLLLLLPPMLLLLLLLSFLLCIFNCFVLVGMLFLFWYNLMLSYDDKWQKKTMNLFFSCQFRHKPQYLFLISFSIFEEMFMFDPGV